MRMNKYVLCYMIFVPVYTVSFPGEYLQEAIEDYTACLPLVPNNNLSLKRDVLEGKARCYSHLGKSRQALEICEKLVGYNVSCMSDTVIFYRYCEDI